MPGFTLDNKPFRIESLDSSVAESDLIDFEKKTGQQLPAQLRSYYRQWNGGLPCPEDVPEDKSVWVRVFWSEEQEAAVTGPAAIFSGFMKINSKPARDWFRTWNDFKNRIPADTICFARDPGGSLFLIGTHSYNFGKIYYWSRGYEVGEDAIPDYRNVAFVADSLVDFLLALRPEPESGEAIHDWINRVYGA